VFYLEKINRAEMVITSNHTCGFLWPQLPHLTTSI